MIHDNTPSWADTDLLIRDCKPRRGPVPVSSRGFFCTGPCSPPRRTADSTDAAGGNKQWVALLLGGRHLVPHDICNPFGEAYSNPSFLEEKAVEGRKGFNWNTAFIKIKKLILTLGPEGSTVTKSPSPNEMSKQRARAEQGPKR